jgi:ABC-type dipeptide/oligopeptide/nickel transport system permease component
MARFLMKRLLGLVFVVLGVTFVTFIMGYLSPDDPVVQLLGQHYTPETYNQLKHAYGLDLPWYQQYGNFLNGLFHLDFGFSFQYKGRAVWDILKEGVPVSLELGLWALVLQMVLGIPVGIMSALRANTWIDTLNMGTMLIIYGVPAFIAAVVAQLLIVSLDVNWGAGWPVAGWGAPWSYSWEDLQFKLAPIVVLSLAGMAYYARLTRTSMMDVLRQDFVRTARAKGIREPQVVYRHALRNAMLPLITVFGASLGALVTGAFFTEHTFNIPGIAETTLTSIYAKDFHVVQATVVLLAVSVVLGNLVADLLYSVADPRIKAE